MRDAPYKFPNCLAAGASGSGVLAPGVRSRYCRLQPHAIALYASQGVPMVWEGEEFGDDYNLPDDGSARVNLRRDSFYYWQQSLQNSRLIAYHRHAPADPADPGEYAMVILNFAPYADTISVPFPKAGSWAEKLDEDVRPAPWIIPVATAGDLQRVTVPSNYGFIFLL